MTQAALPTTLASAAAHAAAGGAVEEWPPIGDRKLRLLCLHGYMQNAEIFRSRLGSLRKALKSRAEFVFVDAPYPASPPDDPSGGNGDDLASGQGRSWWQWRDLEPGTRPSRAAHYHGWEASQAAIQAALQQHAPVDGLLGFSQGATATALFLAHTQPKRDACQADAPQQEQQQDQLRFACLCAGFLPRDPAYAEVLRQRRPALPSLHVCGGRDELVPEERSAALWACFAPGSVRTYKHGGAHMVPTCSGEFKHLMVQLLDAVRQGRQRSWQPAAAAAVAEEALGSGGG